jgi:hypothetical protein
MGKWVNIVLWLIVGFVFIGVLTHAAGFSLAAGTLFSGTNSLGATLEGNPGATTKTKAR